MAGDLVGLGLILLFAVVANVESVPPPAKDLIKLPPRICPPVCAIFCPFGNVLDSRGCPTCRCKKEPPVLPPKKCGPICRKFCPNGFVKDKRGCPICKCKPFKPIDPPIIKPPICGPVCMIHCPFGNVMDSRGCPTCRCRPGPLPTRRCPRGSVPVFPRRTCKRRFPIFGKDECGKNGFCYRGNKGRGICCRRLRLPPIGKCPVYKKDSKVLCKRIINQCKSDFDCKGGRCCPGRCGRVCSPNKPYLPM